MPSSRLEVEHQPLSTLDAGRLARISDEKETVEVSDHTAAASITNQLKQEVPYGKMSL